MPAKPAISIEYSFTCDEHGIHYGDLVFDKSHHAHNEADKHQKKYDCSNGTIWSDLFAYYVCCEECNWESDELNKDMVQDEMDAHNLAEHPVKAK